MNYDGVAGAVLQTSPPLINSLSNRSFSTKSSKHYKSQTIRARDLNFYTMLTPCRLSPVACFFSFLQSGEASRGRVCYQRGQPRLEATPGFARFC